MRFDFEICQRLNNFWFSNLHILIKRAHAGEISFPGGRCETGETVVETAIRETTEELGIESDKIDVWDAIRPVTDKKGKWNFSEFAGHLWVRFDYARIDKH